MNWTSDELEALAASDDFRIAPYREDGETPGTLTFIWSVVADGALYVRAYSGTRSRWYQAALREKAGRITAAGMDRTVAFAPVDEPAEQDRIDAAYRAKYGASSYLGSMISERARAATMRVTPKAQ